MHPRLAELADLLARHRAELLATVAAIPADRRDRKPSPDAWSPAELLEHLRLVEDGSVQLLRRRLARAIENGLPRDGAAAEAARRDLGVLVDRRVRRTAPEIVTPATSVRAADALAGLEASRAALLAFVHDADGHDLTRVKATHAVLGEIDAYEWLEFIALHESRHTAQLADLGDALARGEGTETVPR